MSIEDFVAGDLPANYAEANRRRPTHITGPLISAYLGIYYPRGFQANFRPFLAGLLTFIGYRGDAEAQARAVFNELSHNGSPNNGAATTPPDFIYETANPDFLRGHWRLEVHREYVALTLFVGLDIETRARSVIYTIPTAGAPAAQIEIPRTGIAHQVLLAALFAPERQRSDQGLDGRFQTIVDGALERLTAFLTPFAREKEKEKGPKIFARIYGATIPWTALGVGLKYAPVFPNRRSRGYTPDGNRSDDQHLQETDRFLGEIWPQGIAAHLLGGADHDCVACFLQNGHALYISDLGHRNSSNDRTPLKYLVLYSDADGHTAGSGQKSDGVSVAPRSVRSADLVETNRDRLATQYSWRLSRLVGRLHDLGAARLAALRNQRGMMAFSQRLRGVERMLQSPEAPTHDDVRHAEIELQHAARQVREPIAYRSARTRYYLETVEALSRDLGVVSLPSYQPYTHYVRRRLFGQMNNLARIGARYEHIVDRIEGQYNSHLAREILDIQRLADIVGAVVIIHYAMQIVEDLNRQFAAAGPWLLRTVKGLPRLPAWPTEAHESEALLILLAGAFFYLAMGNRVLRTAMTWRPWWLSWPFPPPEHRKRKRGRLFQLLLALILLAPYIAVAAVVAAVVVMGRALIHAVRGLVEPRTDHAS